MRGPERAILHASNRVSVLRTSSSAGSALSEFYDRRLVIAPIGLDHFSDLRNLHAAALREGASSVLSEDELAAMLALVQSHEYSDQVLQEETVGGWIDDELVGTASWHTNSDDGRGARIGWVFVRHPGFGIGRRLVTEVEARAQHSGFNQLAVSATANAILFFERLGYQVASRGVRNVGPNCALPVAFMRKFLMRPVRARLT